MNALSVEVALQSRGSILPGGTYLLRWRNAIWAAGGALSPLPDERALVGIKPPLSGPVDSGQCKKSVSCAALCSDSPLTSQYIFRPQSCRSQADQSSFLIWKTRGSEKKKKRVSCQAFSLETEGIKPTYATPLHSPIALGCFLYGEIASAPSRGWAPEEAQ